MRRLHLTYMPLSNELEVTREFMDAKPWRNEGENFLALANTWAEKMCRIHSCPPVSVVAGPNDGYTPAFDTPDGSSNARILLDHASMFNLFWMFAIHLTATGQSMATDEDRGLGYACSLFYKVKPAMYRKRVRERRIFAVDPYTIYSSETERALKDYDVDPCAPNALTLLEEAQADALSAPDESVTNGADTPTETVSESADVTPDDIRAMNTRQLRVYATAQGLTGTWGMSKTELLEALGASV